MVQRPKVSEILVPSNLEKQNTHTSEAETSITSQISKITELQEGICVWPEVNLLMRHLLLGTVMLPTTFKECVLVQLVCLIGSLEKDIKC